MQQPESTDVAKVDRFVLGLLVRLQVTAWGRRTRKKEEEFKGGEERGDTNVANAGAASCHW